MKKNNRETIKSGEGCRAKKGWRVEVTELASGFALIQTRDKRVTLRAY